MRHIPPPHEDTPEYLTALRHYLAPIEGTDFYAGAWYDRTDIERFHGYVDLVELP